MISNDDVITVLSFVQRAGTSFKMLINGGNGRIPPRIAHCLHVSDDPPDVLTAITLSQSVCRVLKHTVAASFYLCDQLYISSHFIMFRPVAYARQRAAECPLAYDLSNTVFSGEVRLPQGSEYKVFAFTQWHLKWTLICLETTPQCLVHHSASSSALQSAVTCLIMLQKEVQNSDWI